LPQASIFALHKVRIFPDFKNLRQSFAALRIDPLPPVVV